MRRFGRRDLPCRRKARIVDGAVVILHRLGPKGPLRCVSLVEAAVRGERKCWERTPRRWGWLRRRRRFRRRERDLPC